VLLTIAATCGDARLVVLAVQKRVSTVMAMSNACCSSFDKKLIGFNTACGCLSEW